MLGRSCYKAPTMAMQKARLWECMGGRYTWRWNGPGFSCLYFIVVMTLGFSELVIRQSPRRRYLLESYISAVLFRNSNEWDWSCQERDKENVSAHGLREKKLKVLGDVRRARWRKFEAEEGVKHITSLNFPHSSTIQYRLSCLIPGYG